MPRQTLEILARRFNPFHRRKCFDLRRKEIRLRFRFVDGVIAQLVERLNGIQEVRSSSLLGSTILATTEISRGNSPYHPIIKIIKISAQRVVFQILATQP